MFVRWLAVFPAVACLFAAGCGRLTPPIPGLDTLSLVPGRGSVVAGEVRFTVLTPAMIRMEWSPTQQFENRPSFQFVNREAMSAPYRTGIDGDWIVIDTDELVLRYLKDSGIFNERNLSVRLKAREIPAIWRPGMADRGNLGGTVRTLDGVSGSTPLGPGLLSRDGWVLLDDSATVLLDDSDWPWAAPRREAGAVDWYFLGYGHDYKRALLDYTRAAGPIPMPPRWAFGAWWSRYWSYTDKELMGLVGEFNDHDVPLDVLVIDMGWHLKGWTGYTWDPACFPNPEEFLAWCREQDLRVPLNLHPAQGVGKHEAAFRDVARAMGLDPDTVDNVPFNCVDRRYVEAYFKYLHHPLERQGIDFWWIDWQQGTDSGMPDLDPLTWLNYLHWTDMERNPERENRRPILLSRWGGPGGHRQQIGFSGDTHCNWPSLAFQPYFTATAGNVAYPYWSHDIGGHIPGPVDGELYARWIQFGALSPILRTHAGSNPLSERRIWGFPPEIFETARDAFHLRYALHPYFYAAARECYDTGLPLLRPLYYEWPELDAAYDAAGEYLLGDRLLVAPATSPRDENSSATVSRVWFPPGRWHHWFTGRAYQGPATHTLMTPLDQIPLFVRDGGIVPANPPRRRLGEKPSDALILHVFPGQRGDFTLYEDDGATTGYTKNEYAKTVIQMARRDNACELTVSPAEGGYPGMAEARSYELRFREIWPPSAVTVDGRSARRGFTESPDRETAEWEYDPKTLTAVVRIPAHSALEPLACRVELAIVDETPIRAGLRGDLDLLDELAARLGKATPAGFGDVLRVRDTLATDPDSAAPRLSGLASREWPALIRDVAAAHADIDPALAREAFLRMTGLATSMETKPRVNGGGVEVVVSAEASRPIDLLDVDPDVAVPDGWTLLQRTPPATTRVAPGAPVVFRAEFQPAESTRTATIQARVAARAGDIAFDFDLTRVILPSIDSWWIIGPFDCPWEDEMKTAFPPESGFDPAARYDGKSGRSIRWRKATRGISPDMDLDREFLVDLRKQLEAPATDNAVAYAATWIDSPRDLDAVLAVGSDDGIAAWLNGESVLNHQEKRGYHSKSDRAPIRLKQGANFLLLKITQDKHGWSFCAHLETPEGTPLTEVRTRLSP